ncbi:MAG: hypothetical protein M1595_00435 [Candidatus Thermoplasmatota archaeon]|nr:hypothetical protein [Candidatus Thermoplasmatota archaeon]
MPSPNMYTEIVNATEPHDQLALIAAIFLLAAALYFSKYAPYLIVVTIILVVGVLVDLTAHGWDH